MAVANSTKSNTHTPPQFRRQINKAKLEAKSKVDDIVEGLDEVGLVMMREAIMGLNNLRGKSEQMKDKFIAGFKNILESGAPDSEKLARIEALRKAI